MSALSTPAAPAAIVLSTSAHRIERTPRGYFVDGVAFVFAAGHRKPQAAREIAMRIADDPTSYLATIKELRVPGIADIRGLAPTRATLEIESKLLV